MNRVQFSSKRREDFPLNVVESSWGRQVRNGGSGNRDIKVPRGLSISWGR